MLQQLVESEMIKTENDVTVELIKRKEQTPVESRQSALQILISQAMKQVKTTPNIASVIQFLKENDWPASIKATIDEAIIKAEQFHEAGRELAARQELATALNGLAIEPTAEEPESMYRLQSETLAVLPIESRNLIVTTITKNFPKQHLILKW
ncbi:hypothetical protein ACI2OX_04955 [Bacillus sp. N9]